MHELQPGVRDERRANRALSPVILQRKKQINLPDRLKLGLPVSLCCDAQMSFSQDNIRVLEMSRTMAIERHL